MAEKKKATAAHMRATAKYEKTAYFKTLVRFPKEEEERIREAAGDSLNGFIVRAVSAELDRIENHNKSKVYSSDAGSKEVDALPFPEVEQ